MSHLRDITGGRYAAEGDSKPKQESSSHEHASIDGGPLNSRAQNDYKAADEHACPSSPPIIYRTSKEDSGNRSNVVYGENDASG